MKSVIPVIISTWKGMSKYKTMTENWHGFKVVNTTLYFQNCNCRNTVLNLLFFGKGRESEIMIGKVWKNLAKKKNHVLD